MPSINQQFNNDFEVEAPPEIVWSFLWDIEAMARCIPGCEEVITREDKKDYLAKMRRKVGPFVIRMEMDIKIIETEAPRRIVVDVIGNDRKLRSELKQRVTLVLSQPTESRSRVDIETQFELNGLLATLGWTLLQGHIRHEVENFAKGVQAGIEEHKAKTA